MLPVPVVLDTDVWSVLYATSTSRRTADPRAEPWRRRWVAATAIAVGGELLAGDGIYADAPSLRLLQA